MNKDLTGIGISTMVAGMIGGLPIIAVIIRSTVNIHNGAKTKWSNLYQGLLLLLFICGIKSNNGAGSTMCICYHFGIYRIQIGFTGSLQANL